MNTQSVASFSPEVYKQAKALLVELYATQGTKPWKTRQIHLFHHIKELNMEEAELIMINLGEE